VSERLGDTVDWMVHSPVFFVLLTLAAYRIGREARDRTGGHALAQPVLVAVALVGTTISVLGVDYDVYRSGTEMVSFWLGPATVALAVPLHRQAHRLRGFLLPLLVAIPLGAVVSVASAVTVVQAFGGGPELARTLAPASTTTPVAIALSETAGGLPPLTAVLAVTAGILGAVTGPTVLTLLRIRERRARGLALGAVSHGIGTSRALAEDATEGAFAALSMGLTALATSFVLPVVVALLVG
jgi:predicted murein hydrolase (TIGR00659 family)